MTFKEKQLLQNDFLLLLYKWVKICVTILDYGIAMQLIALFSCRGYFRRPYWIEYYGKIKSYACKKSTNPTTLPIFFL